MRSYIRHLSFLFIVILPIHKPLLAQTGEMQAAITALWTALSEVVDGPKNLAKTTYNQAYKMTSDTGNTVACYTGKAMGFCSKPIGIVLGGGIGFLKGATDGAIQHRDAGRVNMITGAFTGACDGIIIWAPLGGELASVIANGFVTGEVKQLTGDDKGNYTLTKKDETTYDFCIKDNNMSVKTSAAEKKSGDTDEEKDKD